MKREGSRVTKFTCIEAFCGSGGMALGLHDAGFEILLAFDADEAALETYKHNLPGLPLPRKVEDLKGRELLSMVGLNRGELDLLSGGPPCQGLSKQKRGAHNGDVRNLLILEYSRLVSEVQPRFFLLENVAMLAQKRGKAFVEGTREMLGRDYEVLGKILNCADYGLAQTRERFVVVGKRRDVKAAFEFPEPHVKKWKTVGEVLRGLPEPPKNYTDHPQYPNHQNARVTDLNIKRFSFVPQGGGWHDIPMRYRLKCHQVVDVTRGGWPDVYGRLEWKGQCPTITGGFDSFTRGRYGHPLRHRPLTPREAARLQGFPDRFVFFGNRGDIRSQIGNAVPPPVAEVVGKRIRQCLLDEDKGISRVGACRPKQDDRISGAVGG